MSLSNIIEALLFVTGNEISVAKLATMTEKKEEEVEKALSELSEKYQNGVILLRNNSKVRLATNPEIAEDIAAHINAELTGDLTKAQLETLTIIAYRGPIIKTEIEMIRGVNCTVVLRNLMMRGFIEEQAGVVEASYTVTMEFLRFLGVRSSKELPDFEILAKSDIIDQLAQTLEQTHD